MSDLPFGTTFWPSTTVLTFTGGPWSAGDVIVVSWTSVTVDSPCGSYPWAMQLHIDTGALVEQHAGSLSAAGSFTWTLPVGGTVLTVSAYTDGFCSTGTVHNVTATRNGSPIGIVQYCAYGTQSKTGTGTIIVTDTIVTIVLQSLGLQWLAVIFDAISGYILQTNSLCGQPQPAMPASVTNLIANGPTSLVTLPSVQDLIQGFESLAWSTFCECQAEPPGLPPPQTYPPPTITNPSGGAPAPLALGCDEGDLCTILNQIFRQQAATNQQLQLLRQDVTLIQRQKVPFAYIGSTVHPGLTGSGHFTVQGLLGVRVELTTIPAGIGETSDDPLILLRAGWIATGTADGWRRSVPVSHSPLWVDVEPDDTRIGYTFVAGVVATIEEFVREP